MTEGAEACEVMGAVRESGGGILPGRIGNMDPCMVAERATSRRTPRVAHRVSHTAYSTPRVAHSKFYTAHSKFYTARRTQ